MNKKCICNVEILKRCLRQVGEVLKNYKVYHINQSTSLSHYIYIWTHSKEPKQQTSFFEQKWTMHFMEKRLKN